MESSTWCTRRLGGSVATSAEPTIAVTLAKPRTTTSSRLSSDARFASDRPSTAAIPQIDPCPSSPPAAATPAQHHDHGPFPSLCDLCERLRGGRIVPDRRSREKETAEGRHDRMTRCGQRSVPDPSSARTSADPQRRPEPDDPSSTSYVSSVVRWSSTRAARSSTSREQQTLTWTILFLFLVLVFSASADLQKPTSRERSSKEEGGESIDCYSTCIYIYIYVCNIYFRFDRFPRSIRDWFHVFSTVSSLLREIVGNFVESYDAFQRSRATSVNLHACRCPSTISFTYRAPSSNFFIP